MNKLVIFLVCALVIGNRVAVSQEQPQPAPAQAAGKPQGTKFFEESLDSAPLVGLEVGIFSQTRARPEAGIYSLRPIWQAAQEREEGLLSGVNGVQTIRLEAPAGTIVSSIVTHVEKDQVIGLRLIYTKPGQAGKESATVQSRWVGGRGKEELTFSAGGQPITAIEGTVDNRVTSFGVRFGEKSPEKSVGVVPFMPTAEYAAALKEVESWKVETTIDEDAPGRPIKALRIQSRTLTPNRLETIGKLGSLEEIAFSYTFGPITAEQIAPLAKLPRLKSLEVIHSYWFNDSHLLALRDLKDIVKLNVTGTRVTGAGLSQIRGWRKLQHLSLNDQIIDDSAMIPISRMTWLEHLILHDTAVSDEGLRRLEAVKGLKTLRIHSRRITDEGFEVLKQLPELTDVAVNGGRLTDASFDSTTHLKLKVLSVSGVLRNKGLAALAIHTDVTEFRMINDGPVELDFSPLKDWKKLDLVYIQEGQVTGDGLRCFSPETMRHLELVDCQLTEEHGIQVASLQNLEHLMIDGSQLSEEFLAQIGKLKKLKFLNLRQCGITDAGLAQLKDLPDLKTLGLSSNNFTGAGLKEMTGLPLLQGLDLQMNRVVDNSMPYLANFPALQQLNLDRTNITDAGIAKLTALPKLDSLTIGQVLLTAASLPELAKLTSLKVLNLNGGVITDADLPKLKPLTKLVHLGLAGTRVTNEGIPHLDAFPELLALYADRTKISDKGTARARQTHPHLEVWRSGTPDRF